MIPLFTQHRAASFALVLSLLSISDRRAQQFETIDIAVEDAAAPWSQPDGRGYANDVVRAAFDAVGIDARLHVMPYARCKALAVRGDYVACVTMSPAPELVKTILFSKEPLFTYSCVFFENPDHPIGKHIDDLSKGTVVATVLGYEYPPEVLAHLAARGVVVEPAATEEINLRKLASRRVAAVIVNRDDVKSADRVAVHAGVATKVRAAFNYGSLPGYVGFSLANPRGRALAKRFDAGMEKVIQSGERERIRRSWIARGATSSK